MFRNPCKRCLVQACCSKMCDALTKRTKFWTELMDGARITAIYVIIGLIITLLIRFLFTIGVN